MQAEEKPGGKLDIEVACGEKPRDFPWHEVTGGGLAHSRPNP
jgi:hypothetical protein